MLGWDLVERFRKNYDVIGIADIAQSDQNITFHQINLTDRKKIWDVITKERPDVVIHSAAFTNVDACESQRELVFKVNADGTKWVAESTKEIGAQLFYISTDYVFDGLKKQPYNEEDLPNPKSIYGESKLAGEVNVKNSGANSTIIRTSWLFGWRGGNFFRTILKSMVWGERLRVVNDQVGAPTYTKDLADALFQIVHDFKGSATPKGTEIYHIANGGKTTFFDAARKLLDLAGAYNGLESISSDELKRAAKRPPNSVFNMEKMKRKFNLIMRNWDEALTEYWTEHLEQEWKELISLKSA